MSANGRWPLDLPLIRWSRYPRDVWTLRDALQDLMVTGQKGSGKTSGTGRTVARKYLAAGFGGLVLCAQGEEAENWRGYLKETQREADGRFFTLDGDLRFNPIAWEAQKSGGPDFAENIVHLLDDAASIRREPKGTIPFWGEQRQRLLRNTVSLLMLASSPVTLHSAYEVVGTAPKTSDQAQSDQRWMDESLTFALLERATQANGNHPDLPGVKNYFLRDWPTLPDRTRRPIEADMIGLLDPLTRGRLATLFGGETNVSPDDMEDGQVLIIDIPMVHREIAQYAALMWLQSVYRHGDRRVYSPPHTRPLFIYMDECQYFATPTDARFQSTSRHHGFSVVRLTQSLPGLREAYRTQDATDALLSHCCTRIFHLQTCAVTNKWAAESIGRTLQARQTVSTANTPYGNPQQSWAEAEDWDCPPGFFLDLKSGGRRHRNVVEAIVAQAGRTWLDGRRWIISDYRQAKAR